MLYFTTEQVLVSSMFVGVMPLQELKILEIQFSALFPYMLWYIERKYCICLYYTVLQIKVECRQFVSMFVGVMPLLELCYTVLQISYECRQFAKELCDILELKILETHSFLHLSPTCFGILSWIMYMTFIEWTSDQVRVFGVMELLELCPFWNLEYWKYSFPHFSSICLVILSWNFVYNFHLMNFRL